MNKRQLLTLSVLILIVVTLHVHGQTEPPAGAIQSFSLTPPPLTRLDAYAAIKGAVVVKGYTKIVDMTGEFGSTLRISAVEMHGAPDGTTARGLAIQVNQIRDGQNHSSVSYIDDDEIDALISAVETLAKLDNTATKLASFDADYRTRGELEISNLAGDPARIVNVRSAQIQIPSGQVVWATASFRLDRLTELRTQLAAGKRALEQAGSK